MPSVLPFTERRLRARLGGRPRRCCPPLREAKIEEGINGLFSFTTDGMPLHGRVRGRHGLLGRRGRLGHPLRRRRPGHGRVAGRRPLRDLRPARVRRQPLRAPPARPGVRAGQRDCQNFVEVYDILHPLAADARAAPAAHLPVLRAAQQELGAVFLEANGWERPHWYEANAALVDGRDIPTPDDWAAPYWSSPIVGAEAQVTRERVAMYDMTALKRIEVTGPGAAAFLQRRHHRQRRPSRSAR